MKIAFVGAGNMASALGHHWAAKGHELFFSFSRDEVKLKSHAAAIGSKAQVASPEAAANWADIILLTTPYNVAPAALAACGDLRGKLIWSIVNPLKPDYSGLQIGTNTSGAEVLASLSEGSRFVAALPPFATALQEASLPAWSSSVFVCGDDQEARETVLSLARELGAEVIDAGPLKAARFFEPAMMGLVHLAYARNFGSNIGLRFLRA